MLVQQTKVVDVLKSLFVPGLKKLLLSVGSLNEVKINEGKVPVEAKVREGGDTGMPMVLIEENTETKKVFASIAKEVLESLEGN